VAVSAVSTILDTAWTAVASDAAETLLTSDGYGFFYVIGTTTPTLTTGHAVDAAVNEPVVTLDGETLYVRSRFGPITLVATVDEEA
jgi:hypothetical protein